MHLTTVPVRVNLAKGEMKVLEDLLNNKNEGIQPVTREA